MLPGCFLLCTSSSRRKHPGSTHHYIMDWNSHQIGNLSRKHTYLCAGASFCDIIIHQRGRVIVYILFETLVFQKYLETVFHRKSNCFGKHLRVYFTLMHYKVPRLKSNMHTMVQVSLWKWITRTSKIFQFALK